MRYEPLVFPKRINIFSGHYGSGKSEIAVNAAFAIKKEGVSLLMADMDIVNPFFRSVDAKKVLEEAGISVAAPLFANTNVDVPALVPEIAAALKNPNRSVILDVGGDEDGARVLGRYHHEIVEGSYDMFFVVNRARPMTQNAQDTILYMESIQEASRLKITRLLNNTHFLADTKPEDILYGLELCREISDKTGIPVAATCILDTMAEGLADKLNTPVLLLNKNILLPF